VITALTEQATLISHEFAPTVIATLLSSCPKLGFRPSDKLIEAMTQRLIEPGMEAYLAPQDLSNVLWGLGSLGVTVERSVVNVLCERAVTLSAQFEVQGMANTLWALCVLGEVAWARSLLEVWNDAIWELCVSNFMSTARIQEDVEFGTMPLRRELSSLNVSHLSQFHQVLLTLRLDEATLPGSVQSLYDTIGSACKAAFLSSESSPSLLQHDVAATLASLGLHVTQEVQDPLSGYAIDCVLDLASPLCPSHVQGAQRGWAVEVDGPSHFYQDHNGRQWPRGSTLLKRRHLSQCGYEVVSVPYWEWPGERGVTKYQAARRDYLRRKLQLSEPKT